MIFLFGKLPAFGDFVARGLSRPLRDRWDAWCSAAIVEARAGLGADFEARYRATPPGRFALAAFADAEAAQAGCIFASSDRVGRPFPLVLGLSRPASFTAGEAEWLAGRLAADVGEHLHRWDSLDRLIHAAGAAIDNRTSPSRPLRPIDPGTPDWIGQRQDDVEN